MFSWDTAQTWIRHVDFLKIMARIVSGEFVWFRTTFTSPVIASQPLAGWLVTHGKLVYGSQGIDLYNSYIYIYRCNNYGIPLNGPMVGEYKIYHLSTIYYQWYISIIIPLYNHIQTDRIYPSYSFCSHIHRKDPFTSINGLEPPNDSDLTMRSLEMMVSCEDHLILGIFMPAIVNL